MNRTIRKIAIMSAIILPMTGLITAAMSWINVGDGMMFSEVWLPAWARAAFLIAPLGTVVFWGIGKAIDAFLVNAAKGRRKLAKGVAMALIMESMVAVGTAYMASPALLPDSGANGRLPCWPPCLSAQCWACS